MGVDNLIGITFKENPSYRGFLIEFRTDGGGSMVRHAGAVQDILNRIAGNAKGVYLRFGWEGREPWQRHRLKGIER